MRRGDNTISESPEKGGGSSKEARGDEHSSLSSLPLEILLQILVLAKEPSLIHACSRTWTLLPSFVSFSKTVAAYAFYEPETNHVESEKPVDIARITEYRGLQWSNTPNERRELRKRLLNSEWFTVEHLAATRELILLEAFEEGLRMFNANVTAADRATIHQFLQYRKHIWAEALHERIILRYPNRAPGELSSVDISHNHLYLEGEELSNFANKWKPRLTAFPMSASHVTDGLLRGVRRCETRALELVRAIYELNVKTSHSNAFLLPRPQLDIVDRAVTSLLRRSSTENVDEYLEMMLLLAAEQLRFNPKQKQACSHQKPHTQLERRSIWIPVEYYVKVIGEDNLSGFLQLVRLNPAVCSPEPGHLRSLLHAAKKAKAGHAKEMYKVYTEARARATQARQELRARIREGRAPR